MKRNYSLDIMKLYFAIIVALYHTSYGSSLPVIDGNWVVLFFFIMSGFFLVSSFDSGKYTDVWDYTLKRVSKIYPHYLLAFVIHYVYINWPEISNLRSVVLSFFRYVPEMFMLSGTGSNQQPLNYPVWHLCCLLVASFILYALLEWNRKTTLHAVCPIIVLLAFTYLGREDAKIWGMLGNFLSLPMLRAFCGIALGMFIHDPAKAILKKMESSTVTALPWFISVLTVFLALVLWTNRMTYAVIIPYIGILVCLMYSGNIFARIFRHPALSRLNTLCVSLFVHHAVIAKLFEEYAYLYENSFVPADVIYLLIVIPYCALMAWVGNLLVAGLKKLIRKLPKSEAPAL